MYSTVCMFVCTEVTTEYSRQNTYTYICKGHATSDTSLQVNSAHAERCEDGCLRCEAFRQAALMFACLAELDSGS